MTRLAAAAALVVALGLGLGAGWLVFGGDEERSRADLACEAADDIAEDFGSESTVPDLLQARAAGTLAQAAGTRGDDVSDVDELGRAGLDLLEAMASFEADRYAEARQGLLDVCAAR